MKKLVELKKNLKTYKLDGYIIPKNDEYFNEYVSKNSDRLKFISEFSGSAGQALVLKKNEVFSFVLTNFTPERPRSSLACQKLERFLPGQTNS